MDVSHHAVERYRQRVGTCLAQDKKVRKRIREDVLSGEIATRSALRKTLRSRRRLKEPDILYVFNAERRAVFVLKELPEGGLKVLTVLKCGRKI